MTARSTRSQARFTTTWRRTPASGVNVFDLYPTAFDLVSIQTSKASVGLAEEDYRIKVIRYRAGVGTNLDVLDAQVALTTAKNNYLLAMYNYNNYRAKLDKSMGVPVK